MNTSPHFRSNANPVFFIAEIGGNHEGDFDYALKLCDLAIESGADAVKFQLYRGESLVNREVSADRCNHFSRFELQRDQHLAIAERVRAAGRHYMASVWDQQMLSWIDPYIAIHKVGSGDLTCYPMLEALAATGKPIILSTGLSTLDEVRKAVDFIAGRDPRYLSDRKLALLQCTSAYPTPDEAANLRVITTLADTFDLPVGFSDHTIGTGAIELAFAFGARIIEKHFTDEREGKTFRDHAVSLTREEVAGLLGRVRRAEVLLGSAEKSPTSAELRDGNTESFRRGLYAKQSIAAGEPLTPANLAFLRPRRGLCASRFYEVIGLRAVRNIAALQPITIEDLTPGPTAE
jgi:N-acetylneuraminate synthase/N,N'-diacetyllegionaminate synthase